MNKTVKIALAGLLAIAIAWATAGCVAERPAAANAKSAGEAVIGISMPTKSLERWNRDGAGVQKNLTDLGYKTTLQYADNKTDQQISQVQNMINQGVDVLVIAPIDGTVLVPVLAQAKQKDIEVISYDRLIEGSDAISYYVTFDNYQVGQLQGQSMVDALKLDAGGTHNVELFAGSPDDPNAAQFYAGAWNILGPHFKKGTLTSPSGKVPADDKAWQSIGVLGWDSAKAQSEMQTRLNSFYAGGEQLEAVLAPADSLSLGIEQALAGKGYQVGSTWPFVTGQDADKANVEQIIAGKQGMTVFKDIREQGKRAALMVDQIVKGEKVEVTEGKAYNNKVKEVPTFLLTPVSVTKDNLKKELVDSGFYSAADLGL